MIADQQLSHNNRIAASLFGAAKLTGIIAVCLVYTGRYVASGILLSTDALLLIASIVVCVKTMNLANRLEGSQCSQ